jgi:heat shock protein HtpX
MVGVSGLYVVALAVAVLLPSMHRMWLAAGLQARAEDPALPERLLHRSRREAQVLLLACLCLGFGWKQVGVAGAAVLLVTTLALRGLVGLPLRRALYGERWTLAAFASFHARALLAFFGFWAALLVAPLVVATLGRVIGEWAAAGGVGAALAWWALRQQGFARRLLRTRVVDRPALIEGFMRLVRRTALPMPRLERVDLHGGVLANAVALPGPSRAAIVLTDTLIDRLEADEVLAICAHEIAHLEQHPPGRVGRLLGLVFGLVAAGTIGVPLLRWVAPDWMAAAPVALWPLMLTAAMAAVTRRRRQNETASDLRAVALSGQPDALIRALVKLHAIARVPRRWESAFERRATHPSLARRLQAIRAAAGMTPPAVDPLTIGVAGRGPAVAFRRDSLWWSEPDGEMATVRYDALRELHVVLRASGAALVAVDVADRRRVIRVPDADLQRLQAALDQVDARLAPAGGGRLIPAPAGVAAVLSRIGGPGRPQA